MSLKPLSLFKANHFFLFIGIASFCCTINPIFSQQTSTTNNSSDDKKLLEDYILSQGYSNPIIFDGDNIKQFWIDRSVLKVNDLIRISLTLNNNQVWESKPLNVQLRNVNESMDCKVEVISENSDLSFNILNNNLKVISKSVSEKEFIQYHIATSVFHMEDALNDSFNFHFLSKDNDVLTISRIILSFARNDHSLYHHSPGVLKMSEEHFTNVSRVNDDNFSLTGKRGNTYSMNKLLVLKNTFQSSVKIKNTGDTPTQVYIGYAVYLRNNTLLDKKNYPYNNNNQVLHVVSSEPGSDTIIVDTLPEWSKNCNLALNAKEDLSDIPSVTFADGTITAVKELANGHAEITMSKPQKVAIEKGSSVRINGISSGHLYTTIKVLQPGEEERFVSTIQKDESYTQFNPKAFPKGAYYVKPLILSYSIDPTQENRILIREYSITY